MIGGCLDREFSKLSRALIELARKGSLVLVVSDLLLAELGRAPEEVRDLISKIPPEHVESIEVTEESRKLRDAYLAADMSLWPPSPGRTSS
ncbi:MAG: hypothetical protein ACYTDY_05920 [Planctomycetota bacterium]